jgi:uncharacterized protein affecting Mg2+/Co2+ transport
LLSPEEAAAGREMWGEQNRPMQRCQLRSRHWIIRDAQGAVFDEVVGDGVIGEYPLLFPGESRRSTGRRLAQ